MTLFKDKLNKVHAPDLPVNEAKQFLENVSPYLMPFTEITQAEAEALCVAKQPTQAQIDAEKQVRAQSLANSPQMLAAIEVITGILNAAAINVPTDISLRIVNAIKVRL